jgi:nicotinamide-nucleotide amidase
VTYTEEAKQEMLGVPADLLDKHGAVSEPVARAMAEGALDQSTADIAVSITGFAGPTPEGEEGLVHFACARVGRDTIHREAHYGAVGRGRVRIEALRTAVELIEEMLE